MPLTIGSGWTLGPGWVGGDAGPAPVVSTDPYFMYNSLLLTGDGTNLAQNNTFLDSSTNNFAITRNGNTTQGTFSPYGDNWSNYFDGSTSYLTTASSSASAGNFTMEAWIYRTAATLGVVIGYGSETTGRTFMYVTSGGGLVVGIYAVGDTTFGGSIPINQWTHIAIVRSSNVITGYINGTAQATTVSSAVTIGNANGFGVGAGKDGSNKFTGYISNARVVVGVTVYTGNFTPPTTPLTAIANTSLLTSQSNRFIDNSTNAFAITKNGSPTVQRWSPFEPSAAYSTSTTGGSGYFDGSGDFLTAPANTAFNLGTGDFTIECWVYLTNSTATTQSIMGIGDTGTINDIQLWYNNVANKITFNVYGNPRFDSSSTVTTGNWIHLACTRASGTFKLFINGAQESTGSLGNNLSNNVLVIGRPYASLPNNEYFYGYISNLRIVKGTAVYTSAFTPPTTPVTAISGTSVLTNFANAGIIDNAMMNDLETVGDAKISTTQSKFGGSSMAFDGAGDRLVTRGNPAFNFGSGSFTVECWVYLNSVSANQWIVGPDNTVTYPWALQTVGTAIRFISNNAANDFRPTSFTLTTGTWNHFAVTRSGSTMYWFTNGTLNGTQTYSNAIGSDTINLQIGTTGSGSGDPLNGYIDDLRITKGYARYTANFTPPTAALPTY